jgi:hypothetical protein
MIILIIKNQKKAENVKVTIHLKTMGPSLLSNGYQGLFPWGYSGQGVKMTTHLHLVLRSNNEWSYTSTPATCLHGVVLS